MTGYRQTWATEVGKEFTSTDSWLSVCNKMQRKHDRMHAYGITNIDNRLICVFCVLLMVASALLTFLGRGTFGLIQGVLGVIIGIEGYYGAMEYSIKNIQRLMLFLIISTFVCIALGVYSSYSTDEYCGINSTAMDEEHQELNRQCKSTVLIWTVLYLSIGLVFNVVMLVFLFRFYYLIRFKLTNKNQIINHTRNILE